MNLKGKYKLRKKNIKITKYNYACVNQIIIFSSKIKKKSQYFQINDLSDEETNLQIKTKIITGNGRKWISL